jgi:short-subunit dehydrogenase
MKMDYKVAVVTGAASGMGAALSRQLAAAGVRVGLISLPEEALDAEAEGIRAKGGTAIALAADVGDPAAFRAALRQVGQELGPIDLLILNAGLGLPTTAVSFSVDPLEQMIRVNLLGVAHGIEEVLPQMIERRRGHIVGVSSLASYRGQPTFFGYNATKSAVAVLLEGLRIELRGTGIAVTTVRPGFVRTRMTTWVRRQWLLMDVDRAAAVIIKGIVARRREVRFPWSAAIFTDVIRALPSPLFERLFPLVKT